MSMSLDYRKNIILSLLQQKSGMGKTAVMKAMFLLQQVKGVKLGYDFSIYTYGPYTSDVMEDIDDLVKEGLLSSAMYPVGRCVGYRLSATEQGRSAAEKLSDEEAQALRDISSFVDGKSARELELYSTIIYIVNLYAKNSWENSEGPIVEKVHEIKPHFSTELIQNAYLFLKKEAYI